MNLFGKREPTIDEPEIGGVEAIRQRVWSRWKRAHLATLSRDLSIPLQALESFAQGAGQLSVAHLELLTGHFFMNARYDAVADRLIDTNAAPPAVYVLSEPYQPREADWIDPNRPTRLAPLPEVVGNQRPASLKRPGF